MNGTSAASAFTARSRAGAVLAGLVLLTLAAILLDLFAGSAGFSPTRTLRGLVGLDGEAMDLLYQFRVPRVATAALAGAALSISGLLMQAWFRNPLAGPEILGITSGASLGAALTLLGTGGLFAGFFARVGLTLSSVLGALLSLVLVALLSTRLKGNLALLVAGMMLSFLVGAVVALLLDSSSSAQVQMYSAWGLGSFGQVGPGRLPYLAIPVGLGLLLALSQIRHLDALLLGEDGARALGVNIGRTRAWLMLSAAILSGAVTAWCGPVAFLGLASAPLARRLLGTTRHTWLFPASLLVGMALALLADGATFALGQGRILPLNAMTSLVGAPIVLYVILSRGEGAHLT